MIKQTKRALSGRAIKTINAALKMYLGYWLYSAEQIRTDPRATPDITRAIDEGLADAETAAEEWLAMWAEELGHEF